MSYNANTGKITAPVSIYDVQQALQTGKNDLRTLCEHINVNKWSKYKPVPLFGFYLNMEKYNNNTYHEMPYDPATHQIRCDWEDLQKWYWGNLWAWDAYGLWRNVVQIAGKDVPMYNIAAMWVPTMDVDNSNDTEYNDADPRNYSSTSAQLGYRSCYKYKDATIAKLAAILQGIAANMNAYNYKQFLHSDITQTARNAETFVYRLTDFKNYEHRANQPLRYTYPLSLVRGNNVVFGVNEIEGNLELDEIMHAASDISQGLPVLKTAIHVICINGNVTKMFGTQWGMSGTTAGVFNDTNYNENVMKSDSASQPQSAQITVAVNDMGNDGDNVTLFLVATLYNYVSAPEGEAGSITVVKNVILPMQYNTMPMSYTIGTASALLLHQLIQAGGNQWQFLYQNNGILEINNNGKEPSHCATFRVRLYNPTQSAVTVDLTEMQIRWTWAGYYYGGWPNAEDPYQRSAHNPFRLDLAIYSNGSQVSNPSSVTIPANSEMWVDYRLMEIWSSTLDGETPVQAPYRYYDLFMDEYMLYVANQRIDAQGIGWVYPRDFSQKYGTSPVETLDNIITFDIVEGNVTERIYSMTPQFTLKYAETE